MERSLDSDLVQGEVMMARFGRFVLRSRIYCPEIYSALFLGHAVEEEDARLGSLGIFSPEATTGKTFHRDLIDSKNALECRDSLVCFTG
jgi:hypothetical protein